MTPRFAGLGATFGRQGASGKRRGLGATISGTINIAGDIGQTNKIGAVLSATPAVAGDISLSNPGSSGPTFFIYGF